MLTYLLDAFSGPASPFMYALLGIFAVALGVTTERLILFWRFRCPLDPLLQRVDQSVSSGSALTLGDTPIESVVRAGLAHRDPELAWDAMAGAAVHAELRIRRRVSYLSTIASVATMVGLFGTVYGLILAFGAMGDVAASARAAQLSEGSATAMATTAFGLFVAIPALLLHAVLEAQVREMLGEVEQAANRVVLVLKSAGRRTEGARG